MCLRACVCALVETRMFLCSFVARAFVYVCKVRASHVRRCAYLLLCTRVGPSDVEVTCFHFPTLSVDLRFPTLAYVCLGAHI